MSAASSLAPSGLPELVRRSRFLRILGKVGYAARSIVFAVLGVLVVMTGFGLKRSQNDPIGALEEITRAPLGRTLTAVVGIGLAAYVVWNVLVGVATARRGKKQIFVGVGYALTGFFYGPLAWVAGRLAFGQVIDGRRDFAGIFEARDGRVLVTAIGIAFAVAAIVQIVIGIGRTFVEPLDLRRLSVRRRRALIALGVVGFVARGALFGLLAGCLVRAVANGAANQAVGPDRALDDLLALPHGLLFLFPLGVGLVAFGVFSLVAVRFLPD